MPINSDILIFTVLTVYKKGNLCPVCPVNSTVLRLAIKNLSGLSGHYKKGILIFAVFAVLKKGNIDFVDAIKKRIRDEEFVAYIKKRLEATKLLHSFNFGFFAQFGGLK